MQTEFKITISSPELAEAINNLAAAISGFKMPTTVSGKELEKAIMTATKEAVGSKNVEAMSQVDMATPVESKTEKADKAASKKKAEQSSMNIPQSTSEITLESLRTLGAKLKAKGVATRQIINDMGYEKLSAVPQERYAELNQRFVTLLEEANGTA